MRIELLSPDGELRTPLLALLLSQGEDELPPAYRKLDDTVGGVIAAVLERGDFRGKKDEALLLYPNADGGAPAERLLLIGLGKADTPEPYRRAGGTLAKRAAKLRVGSAAVLLPDGAGAEGAREIAEGAVLGAYDFREWKSDPEDEEPPVTLEQLRIVARESEELKRALHVAGVAARAENRARTLANLPGNVATPSYLAEHAQRLAEETGMRCEVLGPEELREEGMHALLAVAAGSEQEPRLIVLEHRGGGEGEQPLVLVGKGLTFDAGGISIKPASGMEEMKFDMCGGAAVIAAMGAIAELEVPLNVVGVVPSSENLISGKAMKPGDIIGSHFGKTIEVVNTDAEGRLILADALSYVRRFDPAAVVDAATLTGSCVIALGHQASGVMGNDEALLEELRAAGDRVGERVWPLPMHPEYREQLDSDYADIKNSGGRPAGTITAGFFLKEFVGDFPWAHLDIAGTAYGEGKLPFQRKGATGVPTRLFVEWVSARAG
ncbi:MAG: leucyl aminopeptidase [Longimicrobiaceae bacterium]